MQKTKISARIISMILTLSILLSMFSIFAFAAESSDNAVSDSDLSVAYNRTFSEGWDYDNGIVDAPAKGNTVGIAYEYRDTGYNYYLRLSKQNTQVSYVYVDTADSLATTGKTFIEFDVTSGANCQMGQAVRVSVQGDVKTLVEFREDGMYVLGKEENGGANLGSTGYGLKWSSLSFEFDFSYVSEETLNTAYKVSAYCDGKLIASQVWEYGLGGGGISQVRFAFGDVRESSVGSWYGVDNLRVYSGVDTFTVLESDNYGLAVDETLDKDFVLAGGVADPDGFIRGEADVERKDTIGAALIHYNRTYDEGWTLANGSDSIVDAGNNVDIRSERDISGKKNYFFRYRALNTKNGYMSVPIPSYPVDSTLFVELDLKAGVNATLGGIIQAQSNASKSQYIAALNDGQLELFGTPVGYVGSSWVHLIFEFANELNADGLYTCKVYYGKTGYQEFTYAADFGAVSALRFGAASGGIAEEKYGDWFGMDNLQIYSGTRELVTVPADDYGLGVDADLPHDFNIDVGVDPEAPIDPDGGNTGNTGAGDFEINVDPDRLLVGNQEINRIEYSDDVHVRYNRNFSEGWDYNIGYNSFSNNQGAIVSLESEQGIDLSYNYYMSLEAASAGKNPYGYLAYGGGYPTTGSLFFEFDIRAVEGCTANGIMQIREASGSYNYYLFGIKNGNLYTAANNTEKTLGKLSETEWCHVAVEFDYDYETENPGAKSGTYLIRMWVGDQTYYEVVKNAGTQLGVTGFRIGYSTVATTSIGQFWHMDNVSLYAGDGFTTIPEDVHGSAILDTTAKDFPIQSDAVSLDQMIEESLFMKIGSEYGLVNNVRTPNLTDDGAAAGCPTLIDDVAWIPLDTILNFLSYPIYIHEDGMSFDISTGSQITYITLGRNTALVGNEKITLTAAPAMVTDKNGFEFLGLTVEDIALLFPEFYIGRDNMNMIVFSKYEPIAKGEIAQSLRMDIMMDFLFDYVTADEVYERAQEHTNNFDHPYIHANQEKFDELHEVWLAGRLAEDNDPTNDVEYDETLYGYISRIINTAVAKYNSYSADVEKMVVGDGKSYSGLNPVCLIYDCETNGTGLQHPYPSSAGYDPIGGRLNPPFDHLSTVAFAYQVTRDIRFAQVLYDWANELVDWDHWGPGHFLNCADTAGALAIAYDWCYDVWVDLGLDVDKISDGLFYHGTLQGYLVSTGQPDPHGRAGGNGSNYTSMRNNWNPVCTEGIATCSFAIMSYTGFSVDTKLEQKDKKPAQRAEVYGGEKVREVCTSVIAMNLRTLISGGLEIYAPDGSYEESVGYWAYGANNLFSYCRTLQTCLGDDLGIMDCWGVDRTCYSITHMISSDFRAFPYNDGSIGGSGDSSEFAFVAHMIGDDFLRLVRKMHLAAGYGISIVDTLFYEPVEMRDDLNMPLQYHHIRIHGYTIRSSWDRGAIFTGLLGGNNDDGHGHIDAGQWIYYHGTTAFIEDMGADGYNTYNYFSNNHMYKTTVEGHSVVCLTSAQGADQVPAGQLRSSISPLIKCDDNEYGAYAVVDTSPAYGGKDKYLISSERGILMTNDRKTVIIQDEITPKGSQSLVWLAHYSNQIVTKVELAANNRVAYLTGKKDSNGVAKVLRMTIVSTMPNIGFEMAGPYDFLLDATMRPGDSEAMGKQPENDRSMWQKLMVRFDNRMTINFAVVLEVIDPSDPIALGYTYTPMHAWNPGPDTREAVGGGEIVESVTKRTGANLSDIFYTQRITALYESGEHFDKLDDYYAALTQITYTVNHYGRETFEGNDRFLEPLGLYDEYYSTYDAYVKDVGKTTKAVFAITDLLTAVRTKAEESDSEE